MHAVCQEHRPPTQSLSQESQCRKHSDMHGVPKGQMESSLEEVLPKMVKPTEGGRKQADEGCSRGGMVREIVLRQKCPALPVGGNRNLI